MLQTSSIFSHAPCSLPTSHTNELFISNSLYHTVLPSFSTSPTFSFFLAHSFFTPSFCYCFSQSFSVDFLTNLTFFFFLSQPVLFIRFLIHFSVLHSQCFFLLPLYPVFLSHNFFLTFFFFFILSFFF